MALVVVFAAGALLLVPSSRTDAAHDDAKPNFVLIITDDQGFESIEYMPLLARHLGREGIEFRNSFVNWSLCCPARATILRGQNANNTGVKTNVYPDGGHRQFIETGHEAETLPLWLQRVGYETIHLGKYLNHYGLDGGAPATHVPPGYDEWYAVTTGVNQGFDYTLNENGTLVRYRDQPDEYLTDVLSAKAVDFIARNDGTPFFMPIYTAAPHGPSTPAPRHLSLFPGIQAPRTPNFNEPDISDKSIGRRNNPLSQDAIDLTDLNYRSRIQSLQAVDEMIDAIVQALDAAGELDNTYLLFTSDNGYHTGQHRLTGKQTPYEISVRVPLFIRGPGVPRGAVRHTLVGNVDYAPTILDLADATAPIDMDGRSFAGYLTAQRPRPPTWRNGFYVGYSGVTSFPHRFESVHTGDRVLIEFANGGREYYDLAIDPYQLENFHDTMDGGLRDRLSAIIQAFSTCEGSSCRAAEELTVDSAGPPRLLGGLEPQFLLAGESPTVFVDTVDPDGGAVTVSVAGLPPGLGFDGIDRITGTTQNPASPIEEYDVTVTLADDEGNVVVHSAPWTIKRTPADPPAVLMVVGQTPLSAGDSAIATLLDDNGHAITAAADETLTEAGIDATDVLLISSSVNPGVVQQVVRPETRTPIVSWEPYLATHLSIGGFPIGESTASTAITMRDSAIADIAGLDGTHTVQTALGMSFSRPTAPGGRTAAHVPGDSSRAVILEIDAGAQLVDGRVAPARRATLHMNHATGKAQTAAGRSLILAAVEWAGGSAQPPAAPSIVEDPADAAIDAGRAATFTVEASGSPPLTYQWRRGGVELPGETQAHVTIDPVMVTEDGALFDVVVTNGIGSVTSAAARLTVTTSPPTITAQPLDASVSEGDNAVFTVTASGAVPLGFQWRRDGLDLPDETAASLTVGPTTLADDGAHFDVVVTNAYGTTISDPAALTVTTSSGPPRLLYVAGTNPAPSRDRPILAMLDPLYDLTVIDDDQLTIADATDTDTIVISTSVVPSKIGTTLTDIATPIVAWEAYLFDDLGLAGTSGETSAPTNTTVTITDPTHPIADGLTGTITVTTQPGLGYGTPAPTADIIATITGAPNRAGIFTIDTGDQLTTGDPAPQRRAALFPTWATSNRLTTNGRNLLLNTINWAGGGP